MHIWAFLPTKRNGTIGSKMISIQPIIEKANVPDEPSSKQFIETKLDQDNLVTIELQIKELQQIQNPHRLLTKNNLGRTLSGTGMAAGGLLSMIGPETAKMVALAGAGIGMFQSGKEKLNEFQENRRQYKEFEAERKTKIRELRQGASQEQELRSLIGEEDPEDIIPGFPKMTPIQGGRILAAEESSSLFPNVERDDTFHSSVLREMQTSNSLFAQFLDDLRDSQFHKAEVIETNKSRSAVLQDKSGFGEKLQNLEQNKSKIDTLLNLFDAIPGAAVLLGLMKKIPGARSLGNLFVKFGRAFSQLKMLPSVILTGISTLATAFLSKIGKIPSLGRIGKGAIGGAGKLAGMLGITKLLPRISPKIATVGKSILGKAALPVTALMGLLDAKEGFEESKNREVGTTSSLLGSTLGAIGNAASFGLLGNRGADISEGIEGIGELMFRPKQNVSTSTPTAPKIQPKKGLTPEIQQILTQTAMKHGIDPAHFIAMAGHESGFKSNAVSPTGARGLFQFTGGTGRQYAKKAGFHGNLDAIRNDPVKNAEMAALLYKDNLKSLKGVMQETGFTDEATAAYLAHNLGAGGARGLLRQYAKNPDAPLEFTRDMGLNPANFRGMRTPAEALNRLSSVAGSSAADTYRQKYNIEGGNDIPTITVHPNPVPQMDVGSMLASASGMNSNLQTAVAAKQMSSTSAIVPMIASGGNGGSVGPQPGPGRPNIKPRSEEPYFYEMQKKALNSSIS